MRARTPDKEKTASLAAMAQNILERIGETDAEKYNSQIVKDHYEALHCLAEALAAARGYKSEGTGAHEKLIAWVAKEAPLTPAQADLFNRLREHRNRITYEGMKINPDFLHRNEKHISELHKHVAQLVRQELQ